MTQNKTVKKYEDKIKSLEKIIQNLNQQLESKEIIIDALISKLKIKNTTNDFEENDKVKKLKTNENEECLPGIESYPSEEQEKIPILIEDQPVENKNIDENNDITIQIKNKIPENEVKKSELISQIKSLFDQKSKNTEFKMNFSFEKFIEYAETSYEFSLFNLKVVSTKNPLKQYLKTHLDSLIKFILDNINDLNLNQICSSIFLLNSEMEYKHKLVVFHDVILELNDFSKLNFIASALFNNIALKTDVFSQIIRKIMYHQYCIDGEIFENTNILEYLDVIRANFALIAPEISLWDSLSHFLVNHNLFDQNKKIILSDSIERGFCLRMLCHYLDWDYTYNVFIVKQLYPKILLERGAIHVYYLGILMMNAKRILGEDESIFKLEETLMSILEWRDECSIVSYLILKQIKKAETDLWLDRNEDLILQKNFNKTYLKDFLLL